MVIVCPIKGCDKTFDSLSALKVHFKRVHGNTKICPVCGWKGKNLVIHATTHDDDAHQTLVYLIMRSKGGEVYRTRREIAEELLSVDEEEDYADLSFQSLMERKLFKRRK